jgi:CDP-diacylglycerol--glycerol-3-phosphate 3-phosphatidyltransferase
MRPAGPDRGAVTLPVMTLPNTITAARVALVPVFLIFAYGDSTSSAVAAFIVFGIASASDSLDGYIARRREADSQLGQFLDPLADKLLVGAALVALVDTRDFPLWAALVIGAREVVVQILRTRIVRGGGTLPASRAAKLKTTIQIGMVAWWLLPWDAISWPHWAWLGAALASTLWSGGEYIVKAERPKEAVR